MYLESEITQWAIDKGIIEKADRTTQGLKTVEEVAELIRNVLKNKDFKDDIGDIYVTIVVQAHMNNLSMEDCSSFFQPIGNIKETLADLVQDCSEILRFSLMPIGDMNNFIEDPIGNIYNTLQHICLQNGINFNECARLAYEEIAGRTGKMVDGAFVKDD
jgi:hypothetical protein